MIKHLLTTAVLVCTMAGNMYANNNGNQVFNPQPESVRILQEQMLPQTSISDFEITIIVEFTITVDGETYRIEGTIHIGTERPHFVEVELDVYDSNGNLRYHIESTYNEGGERTSILVTNPSGEEITNIPYEVEMIIEEVDGIVINSLESL